MSEEKNSPEKLDTCQNAVGEQAEGEEQKAGLAPEEAQVEEEQAAAEEPAAEEPAADGAPQHAAGEAEEDPEDLKFKIDNFEDVAEAASEAADQVQQAATEAASQVQQGARTAYKATSQAAKSAAESALKAYMNAGAGVTAKAEEYQAKAEATKDEEPVGSTRELFSRTWLKYIAKHPTSVFGSLVGFVVGICILLVGFWPVALVLVCTWAGMIYGRYREGDAKLVDFLKKHFVEEE